MIEHFEKVVSPSIAIYLLHDFLTRLASSLQMDQLAGQPVLSYLG
jgi:hypothetical protein